VLAPVGVVTLSKVVSGVSSAGLLSVFGGKHGHLSLDHQVVQLESLNQVCVPNVTSVSDTNIFNFC